MAGKNLDVGLACLHIGQRLEGGFRDGRANIVWQRMKPRPLER